MSDLQERLRSIIRTDYPAVLYVNFKELGREFLVCEPETCTKKIKKLLEIRDEIRNKCSFEIPRAQDYMRETFLPLSFDMMLLIKDREETKVSKKHSHLSNYLILSLGQNLWRNIVDSSRDPEKFVDEKFTRSVEELKCILMNLIPNPYVDLSAEFIAAQLAWLAFEFPNLSLYAFSPVSLSETVDCLHFVLHEDTTAQMDLSEQIREYFLVCSRNILEVLVEVRWQLFLNHALRSAIAAILARVMAHDLGSHMLANAELRRVAKVKRTEYFNHLKNYVRARTVFIAEATTADPSWTISLPLVGQVIHPFQSFDNTSSPVCCHIAQSEGVTEVSIEVKHNQQILSYQKDRETGNWLCSPYDVFVAMPTGLVGNHAFYCILENIIRNGAKYGKNKRKQLKVSIRIEDRGFEQCNDFYRVRIWDDHSLFDETQFKTICLYFPPNCCRDIILNSREESWRIIDETGKLVPGGWGIKEMRIASAWLRKERLVDAMMRENDIHPLLLRPIVVDNNGNEKNPNSLKMSNNNLYMGYEFFLLKPKETLIVDQELDLEESIRNQLSMSGIDIVKDIEAVLKQHIRHYILLVNLPNDDNLRQQWLSELKKERDKLPSVLILVTDDKGTSDYPPATTTISKDEYNQLKAELSQGSLPMGLLKAYQKWIQEVLDSRQSRSLQLILHLDKPPTHIMKAWQDTADSFNSLFQSTGWKMVVHTEGERQTSDDAMVYDHHTGWHGGTNPDPFPYFYEPFFKNQPTQIVLFNPPQDKWIKLRLALGLAEAAVTNVAVVDERIWYKREEKVSEEFYSLEEALQRRKIFLPTISYENPKSESQSLINRLKNERVKILVIHQGILDKMFETKEEIEKWVEEVKKDIPFVIVESDRGEGLLPKLPKNARFVPFSAIEEWLSPKGPCKYLLVQTLLSSTKGGE